LYRVKFSTHIVLIILRDLNQEGKRYLDWPTGLLNLVCTRCTNSSPFTLDQVWRFSICVVIFVKSINQVPVLLPLGTAKFRSSPTVAKRNSVKRVPSTSRYRLFKSRSSSHVILQLYLDSREIVHSRSVPVLHLYPPTLNLI
jgi:hypothetical protein